MARALTVHRHVDPVRPHIRENAVFQIRKPVAELSDDQIVELLAEGTETFKALLSSDQPTDADVTEAERIAPLLKQLVTEQDRRNVAAASVAQRAANLRQEFADPAEPEGGEGSEADAEPSPPETAAAAIDPTPVPVAASPVFTAEMLAQAAVVLQKLTSNTTVEPPPLPVPQSSVAALAGRRPDMSTFNRGSVTIVASSDVPDFPTGGRIEDLIGVGKAMVNRMRGFPEPTGDPNAQMSKYGVASIRKQFPDDLIADGHDDYDVVMHAASESRLPGGNLVASAGWCAPSEVVYDLCANESTDGILSIPEVLAKRGGIRFPVSPDFSAIYTNVGFSQTEAQAISGTPKTCYEVPCTTFVDTRLGVTGVCIKASLLMQAGYPELVQRYISGSIIAQAHKVNNQVIAAIATACGAALVGTDQTSTAGSVLDAVELLILGLKQRWRMALASTLEVVAPYWLLGAIRADMAMRTGQDLDSITLPDSAITAWFAVRGAAVQWVYDWQDMPAAAVVYPKNVNLLIYPAGAFIKATNDVINLSAVYDAASLNINMSTALFVEEGLAVVNPCYAGLQVALPICSGGHTGTVNAAQCIASAT
jgi:hypothetical protein